MNKPIVFVFARAPLYGTVKSRLAKDIGKMEALRFYRRTLFDLVDRLRRDGRYEVKLAVTPKSWKDQSGLWPRGIERVDQGNGDLGQRMIHVLRSSRARLSIIVGSDIPGITQAHIGDAVRALGQRSFVVGPAIDGGYWLIGSRHPSRLRLDALHGVRWSSPHARLDTVARLNDVAVLQSVLMDVDDGAAFAAYNAQKR